MRLNVEVNADDIVLGEPSVITRCPIARAVRRTLDGLASEVRVTPNIVTVIGINGTVVKGEMPRKAKRFIEANDGGEPVKPFTFRLTLGLGNF